MFLRDISEVIPTSSYIHNIRFQLFEPERNLENAMWSIMVPYHIFVQAGLFYLSYHLVTLDNENQDDVIFDAIDAFVVYNKSRLTKSFAITDLDEITGLESLLQRFAVDVNEYKTFLRNYLHKLKTVVSPDVSALIEYALRYDTVSFMPIGYQSNHFPAHEVGQYHQSIE